MKPQQQTKISTTENNFIVMLTNMLGMYYGFQERIKLQNKLVILCSIHFSLFKFDLR